MKKIILPAMVLGLGALNSFAVGAVPAEITQAQSDVSATFTSVFAVGVTIAVALIGLRLLKRVAK